MVLFGFTWPIPNPVVWFGFLWPLPNPVVLFGLIRQVSNHAVFKNHRIPELPNDDIWYKSAGVWAMIPIDMKLLQSENSTGNLQL